MTFINGTTDDDYLLGTTGDDTLEGLEGNDFLVGDDGNDAMLGGDGEDYIYGDGGNDTLSGGDGYDNLNGGDDADTIDGGLSDDLLDGGAGDDLLLCGVGSDTLIGGGGNDHYSFRVGDGQDTLILADNLLTRADFLAGNGGTLEMLGVSGRMSLAQLHFVRLGDSSDLLISVDGASDQVAVQTYFEGGSNAWLHLLLADTAGRLEDLVFQHGLDTRGDISDDVLQAAAGVGLNRLYGLEGDDTLLGGVGNDVLEGGAGSDLMTGGAGDDTYSADAATDSIVELAGEGNDTVVTGLAWVLADTLENLILTGGAAVEGTGNSTDNRLTGNGGNNVLRGLGGNDTLDGGSGADTLEGGLGNDRYVVDTGADVIIEAASSGTDTVESSVSYTLGTGLEHLTLTGTAGLSGTGNTLNNVLTGNSGANTLTGGMGYDTLRGGAGNDTYVQDSVDLIEELANEGADTVQSLYSHTLGANLENLTLTGTANRTGTGNNLNNVLTGNSGSNTLTGGLGFDTLRGGKGNDTYVQDSEDIIEELAYEGIDTVQSSVSYTLGTGLEHLFLTGTAGLSGTGNSLNNMLTGNSGANTLIGGMGYDTLRGGSGNDTYVQDSVDIIEELAYEGTDTVLSSVSYTLGAGLENMTLTGTAGLSGTGNSLNNILTGNSGANTLTGGMGYDTLRGGAGNDTYVQDSVDVIEELEGEGTDTVLSLYSHTLGANLENLTLTGTSNRTGTGNSLNNVLTGNSGANTLSGGLGNDTYVGSRGMGADTVVESDATAGNTDVLSFLSGVAHDQLWFLHSGNNLEVSIIGTADKAVIRDWYVGEANRVERILTADGGKELLSSEVEALVTAMAGLTPPPLGQTSLTVEQHAALDGVIAANWS